jgi:hypothetical protein
MNVVMTIIVVTWLVKIAGLKMTDKCCMNAINWLNSKLNKGTVNNELQSCAQLIQA